jgi:hypothetical protein
MLYRNHVCAACAVAVAAAFSFSAVCGAFSALEFFGAAFDGVYLPHSSLGVPNRAKFSVGKFVLLVFRLQQTMTVYTKHDYHVF